VITFVVPAFNEEAYIGRCLRSIAADNADRPHEVIVVDNGSTDLTVEIAHRLGATVISEDRKGVTRARQTGFEAAKNDTVAFIDADNEVPDGWTLTALEMLDDPRTVVVSGPPVYFEMSRWKRGVVFAFYLVTRAMSHLVPVVQGGCFALKGSALRQIGGFDKEIEFYGEDTDTAVRLSHVGKVVFSLDLCMWSSARRLTEEGLFLAGGRYVLNFIWVQVLGRPYSDQYRDIRPQ
jgi:glycosyltransferase involved in cell wall biosynthesis